MRSRICFENNASPAEAGIASIVHILIAEEKKRSDAAVRPPVTEEVRDGISEIAIGAINAGGKLKRGIARFV